MARTRDYRAERLRRDELAQAQGYKSYRQKRYQTQDKPAVVEASKWKAYTNAVSSKKRTPENAKLFLRDFGPNSGGKKYLRKESKFIQNLEEGNYQPDDDDELLDFYSDEFDWDAWREQYESVSG